MNNQTKSIDLGSIDVERDTTSLNGRGLKQSATRVAAGDTDNDDTGGTGGNGGGGRPPK
ncbi:MAG: hypothetical protein HRU25_08030 [Psychrobium sp.]|nr:hypothetical protein [Psychrobium sp.]